MSIDLSSKYGSLAIESPIIVGACPMTAEEMMRVSMVSAGVGAIVLPSLFEEQVILWNERNGVMVDSPARGNLHDQHVLERAVRMRIDSVCEDAQCYLALVERASSQMSIPVIASLNGECDGTWDVFAGALQAAGADGIELHVRQPPPGCYTDPREIEDAIVATATQINEAIEIPLFLKLGRNYTSVSQFSRRLLPQVSGLVLFGKSPRVDINLDSLRLSTSWGLSEQGTISRSLESIMRVHAYCPEMSLAASGGVGNSSDLIKVLLAGADAAMVTSALYRDGPTVIGTILEGLIQFMEHHQMQSLQELKSQRPLVFDSDSDRIDYIKALSAKTEPGMVRSSSAKIEGDRWGHPHAPR